MQQKYKTLLYNILNNIVAADTVNPPGNEKNAAIILYNLFSSYNINCEIQDLGDNRANVIAQIGTGKPCLEFNGHLDVVPFTDDWDSSPLDITKVGELLYGRGTTDMKGGIASMCAAMIALKESAQNLKGTLRLSFVADEECLNLGVKAYTKKYTPSDMAIIGEPTNLNIAVASRGIARHYIDIKGEARHAALQPTTDTAVTNAAKTILAIQKANEELKNIKHDILPPQGISVTLVHGYEKDNIIPANVRILTDYRLHPDKSDNSAQMHLEQILAKEGINNYDISLCNFMYGSQVSPKDNFVEKCCEITQKLLAREQKPIAFDASCEQCFFTQNGTKAIVFGPGSLSVAHIKNEYVDCKELEMALECYYEIAKIILS